jgi:DNA helicase II / ATP-dependent DNA helicase PcrA
VLFRTARTAQALELELARRGIPFVKYGGLRFLESAHLKDVLAVLRWADNPHAALAATRAARLVPGIGAAALARLLAVQADAGRFEPPRAAAAAWGALAALLRQLREAPRWPDDLHAVLAWYRPQLERLHADARERWADLEQLAAVATRHGNRAAFVTDLTLEPPAAHGAESGEPHRDEDWLVLSTLHSAKGQEWSAVHILRVVDGAIPADLATGRAEEIAEERRLLYVGMTRARDTLALWAPQSFHVTQQRAWGGRHVGALRSRFIDAAVMATLDLVTPEPPAADAPLPPAPPPLPAHPAPALAEAGDAGEAASPAQGLLARLAQARHQAWRGS